MGHLRLHASQAYFRLGTELYAAVEGRIVRVKQLGAVLTRGTSVDAIYVGHHEQKVRVRFDSQVSCEAVVVHDSHL